MYNEAVTPRIMRSVQAVAALLAATAVCGCAPHTRQTLRVATVNLAHGRGASTNPIGQIRRSRQTIEENLDAIAACLKRQAPDVVALQEADAASDWSGGFDHVTFLAEAAGYPHRYHGLHVDFEQGEQKIRYGTALLARRGLADARAFTFRPSLTDSSKGYVAAEMEFAGRPVLIVSVHLHSKSAAARRRQARALIEQLQRAERLDQADGSSVSGGGKPDDGEDSTAPRPALIVMGDLNATWNRTDGAVRQIAEELDLHAFQPENETWDTYPSFKPRWRIDWILISRDLQFHRQRRWRDRVSDHLGVVAELVWR